MRTEQDRFGDLHTTGDGCHEWTAARDDNGYGLFTRYGGKQISAHRLAWILAYGELPKGVQVCHHCDNPPCVRLDHLFTGTNADNMADMVAKGRHRTPRGEAHLGHVLTEAVVRQLRIRRAQGATLKELMAEFGTSQGAIQAVLHGRTWRHVE